MAHPQNPNPNPNPADPTPEPTSQPPSGDASPLLPSRRPFTALSQVDSDLALARTLQEQERAYMLLRMHGRHDSDYESSDGGSVADEDDDDDEDEEDNDGEGEGEHDHVGIGSTDWSDSGEDASEGDDDLGVDPAEFEDDEAFARALQEAEEREVAVRLLALTGLNDWVEEDESDYESNSQDAWQEIDPDDFSYEELVALGDVVGTENRGLSVDAIAALPSVDYKAENSQDVNTDQCVICRLEYEEGVSLVVLSCKHTYHSGCINKWLQMKKVCPVCSTEVSTSENEDNRQCGDV